MENQDPLALMVDSSWEFNEVVRMSLDYLPLDPVGEIGVLPKILHLISQVFPSQSALELILGDDGIAVGNGDASVDADMCAGN